MRTNRTHFFKYFTVEGAAKTLGQKRIRLSKPKLFNDPFDMQLTLAPPFSPGEFHAAMAEELAKSIKRGEVPSVLEEDARTRGVPKEILRVMLGGLASNYTEKELAIVLQAPNGEEHFRRTTKLLAAEMTNMFDDVFVYCLAEDRDNILMWSHYAEKHEGIVIRFECLPDRDNIFLAAQKVRYREDYPTFGTKESWRSRILGGPGVTSENFYNEVVTSKSIHWEYEREWRVVVPKKGFAVDDFAYSSFEPSEVSEIYFGCRMPGAILEDLVQLLAKEYSHARFFRAVQSESSYSLVFPQIK